MGYKIIQSINITGNPVCVVASRGGFNLKNDLMKKFSCQLIMDEFTKRLPEYA